MMSREEYRQPDEDGRFQLSGNEYKAIRAIYAAMDSLAREHGQLERRCRGYKNGWRDLRCLVVLSEKVLNQILKTVPTKKLIQMQKDLRHTICRVETRGAVGMKEDGYMFVPEDDMIKLCESAMQIHCFGCEKTHNEAKHECELYKTIQNIFCYKFDECTKCPFSES